MTDWWARPMSASLARRWRLRRPLRVMVPVVSPYMDRLRDAAWAGERCHRVIVNPSFRPDPPGTDWHKCPSCQIERTDVESDGGSLLFCPNCSSDSRPVPGGQP